MGRRAQGHAGQVPAAPLRGRLGGLQPDPHRPRVRQAGRACRATSCTASTRWPRWRGRTSPPPAATRARSSACRCSSAAWASPSRRSPSPARSRRSATGAVVVDTVAEQGGNQIIRNAEAELRPRAVAVVTIDGVELTPSARASSCARSSRATSSSTSRSARSGSPSRTTCPGARRRCAPSWRGSRRSGCSSIRTPPPGACRPTAATATTSTSCSPRASCRCRAKPVELTAMRREVDEAMRATTEQLSQMTNLLALVTAPPIETATIRRVEVLLLQPQVAMVVVITSTGGVTKRVISYDDPVDPGLVDWAGSYLNEALGGLDVGSRMLARPARRPELSAARARLPRDAGAGLHRARGDGREHLFMEGAARLLSEHRFQELSQIGDLMEMLEHRRALLRVLRESLDRAERLPAHRPARTRRRSCSSLSLVAANYGARAAQPRRGVACSARCAWTTRRRSSPCARRRPSCRASSAEVYDE